MRACTRAIRAPSLRVEKSSPVHAPQCAICQFQVYEHTTAMCCAGDDSCIPGNYPFLVILPGILPVITFPKIHYQVIPQPYAHQKNDSIELRASSHHHPQHTQAEAIAYLGEVRRRETPISRTRARSRSMSYAGSRAQRTHSRASDNDLERSPARIFRGAFGRPVSGTSSR